MANIKRLGYWQDDWGYESQTEVHINDSSGSNAALYQLDSDQRAKNPVDVSRTISPQISIQKLSEDTSYSSSGEGIDYVYSSTISDVDYLKAGSRLEEDLVVDTNTGDVISSSNSDITISPSGDAKIILNNHTWPKLDGNNAGLLSTTGSGLLSLTDIEAFDLAGDTSPQLGGNLDTNTFNVSLGAGEISDANDNTHLHCDEVTSAANYVSISNAVTSSGPEITTAGSDTNTSLVLNSKGPSGSVTLTDNSVELSLPNSDGSANHMILTDGAGALTLEDPGLSTFYSDNYVATDGEVANGTNTTDLITPSSFEHVKGGAVAWAQAGGTGAAYPGSSYNISTHSTAGFSTGGVGINMTFNFENALPDTNYAVFATIYELYDLGYRFSGWASVTSRTTSNFNIYVDNPGSAAWTNTTRLSVVVFGSPPA